MSDARVSARIERLVDEEHSLRTREHHDRLDERALAADRDRLGQLEVELDQCWDLLRQRRARRSAGEDPEAAHSRDASTVESYRQ